MAAEGFFTWGAGGAKLTPEQIALARQLLARKNAQGADTSPVGHWTQGAARVADALGDVLQEKRLNSQEKDLTDYNSGLISNLLTGGGAASAGSPIPSPGAAGEISNTAPAGDPSYRDAIASIESDGSGGYSAVGPTNPKLGRALGRYQIMEANIGPWSQEALGRTVTPEEFLANPQLQDAIFDKKFGSYVQQYGPEGASQAWFAGPGGVGKLDRRDSLGTTVSAYSDKFNRALGGGQQVASLDPAAGMSQPHMPAPEAQAQIQGPQPPAPPLPPATTIAAAPPVASVPTPPPAPTPAPNMQVAQDTGMSGPVLANAIKILSDPRANANTKAVAEIMVRQAQARQQAQYEQQLKMADPSYQQGLQKSAIELENLRNPKMSPAEEATNAREQEKMKFERDKFDAELQKGQWEKMTDGRLYNKTTGDFRDAPPPVPGSVPPKFDDISGLRKEIQQLPSYKNLSQALPIYRSMAETAGRDSKASDLNLVYGLGKIMDPTSVVREGEMVMVKNTASLPDWLQGAIASLNGGAALTPETRQAIMTEAYGRVNGYNSAFKQDTSQYQGIVERNKFNPADVIPDFGTYEPWKAAAAAGAPAQIKSVDEYRGLKPGTQYIDPNGKLRTKQ